MLGDGSKIKGAMRSLIHNLTQKPKTAFSQWRNYVSAVKKGKILSAVKGQKLAASLNKIPARVARDSYDRILGDGSKVKGAMRTLVHKLAQKPKVAFANWRRYVDDVKKGRVLDAVRAQKLSAALSHVPARAIRDGYERLLGDGSKVKGVMRGIMKKISQKPKEAFAKWRTYVDQVKKGKVLDAVRAQKLAASLGRIPVRLLKGASDRILGDGSRVKGALRGLLKKLMEKPKISLQKWRLYVEAVKQGKVLDAVRAQKLSASLSHVPARVLRDGYERLLGDGSKVKGVLRGIMKKISQKPKEAFSKWRTYVDQVKRGKVLDAVRAQKLAASLGRIPVRTLKGASDRILGDGSRIKGALRGLLKKLMEKPKVSLQKWRLYVEAVKKGKVLDAVRAQKLAACLTRIPARILRDANDRILGDGSKVKGVMRGIMKKITEKPKQALLRWRLYVEDVKKGKVLNAVKAQKLAVSLSRIPVRIVKDANDRLLGNGSKVKGVLRGILKKLTEKPKKALATWRLYIEQVKKGKVLDAVRAQKLAKSLSRIPIRQLKNSAARQEEKQKGFEGAH